MYKKPKNKSNTIGQLCSISTGVLFLVCTVLFGGAASSAFAQSIEDDAISFKLGETDLFPAIEIEFWQEDNAFLQSSDEQEHSGVTISPQAVWIADRRLLTIRGEYNGEYSTSSESALSYADHQLSLFSTADITKRQRLAGRIQFNHGHQRIGTNFTRGFGNSVSEPIKFNRLSIGGSFTYGVEDAKGNVEVGLVSVLRNYTNQSDIVGGADFTYFRPYGIFSYRLSGDTRLLAELRYGTYSYDNNNLDRDELAVLGGLRFTATGKLRGTVKIGASTNSYSAASRDDQTELTAEGEIEWFPSSLSKIELSLVRELSDTDFSLGNTAVSQAVFDSLDLVWTRNWSTRFRSAAFVGADSLTRGCPESSELSTNAGLKLSLQLRRWLSLGAGVETTNRDNSACSDALDPNEDLDFSTTRLGFSVQATL